jgi:hypothetical protein
MTEAIWAAILDFPPWYLIDDVGDGSGNAAFTAHVLHRFNPF